MNDVFQGNEGNRDPFHYLRTFQEDEESYQALLCAVRSVVHEREIAPPFDVADIWQRHTFFCRGMRTLASHIGAQELSRAARKALEQILLASADLEDPERDMENRRNCLLALFEGDDDDVVDQELHYYEMLAHRFFRLALQRGDLIVCRDSIPFVSSGGFALREGGYIPDPETKSRFYDPDLRAQARGRRRRKIEQPQNPSL